MTEFSFENEFNWYFCQMIEFFVKNDNLIFGQKWPNLTLKLTQTDFFFVKNGRVFSQIWIKSWFSVKNDRI